MGYLDNSSITVDAVLTKKGREILKNGGNLNISSFTVSDTGVDYTLWNPDHPSGSAYYGEAIENLPMLESSVHAEYNLRNRLVTLNQNTVSMPTLVINGLDTTNGNTLTFSDGSVNPARITIDMVGYNTTQNMGMYFVILDPQIVGTTATARANLSGTSRVFLSEQDIPHAQEYHITAPNFDLRAPTLDVTGKQTNVYVVDIETGAYNSFNVINNLTRDTRAITVSPQG